VNYERYYYFILKLKCVVKTPPCVPRSITHTLFCSVYGFLPTSRLEGKLCFPNARQYLASHSILPRILSGSYLADEKRYAEQTRPPNYATGKTGESNSMPSKIICG